MARKICLIDITKGILPLVVNHLPANIIVTGHYEHFDRAVTTLRLMGDGLPDWCFEPSDGGMYAKAIVDTATKTSLEFTRVPNEADEVKTAFERIMEQYANLN